MEIIPKFTRQTKHVLRKMAFYWFVAFGVFVILILVYRRYDKEAKSIPQTVISQEAEEILQQIRLEIEKEMENYPYDVLSGRNIRNLSDLMMDRGGNPVRSVIVSNWRSGSTFMGEVVTTHPASFYHYEPFFGFDQLRAPLLSQKPLTYLESLFECNFSNLGDHMKSQERIKAYIIYDRHLKKRCKKNANLCYDPKFFTRFCRLFPFQVTKILALDLASMSSFLENQNLDVKIVYLVRDPRGMMNSRKNLDWCKLYQNCYNLTSVCYNAMSDYVTAMHFSKKYPKSFKILRYEDLTNDPWKLGEQIFSFYGIDFHEDVKKFIRTHLNVSHDHDPYSTYRNSRAVTFQWREKLTFEEVNLIQKNCRDAMNVWGYNLATDSDHQKIFNPLKSLSSANINHFK